MNGAPQEVVISIFLFLDRSSIGKVCQLNKKYEKICRTENLWKQLTLNTADSPEERKEIGEETVRLKRAWKDSYRDYSNLSHFFHSSVQIYLRGMKIARIAL
jgi:hypothetical protein